MHTSRKKNVSVYYRIFPTTDIQLDLIKIEDSTLYIKNIHDLSEDNKLPSKYWECKCDGIFNNSSQQFVYTSIIEGLVERLIEGFHGIILGFGQTGAGKSFTLGGLHYTEEEFGIGPRIILDLFKYKNKLPKNIKMIMYMSYTEFSKFNVVDLLKDFPNTIDPWHVKNATKIKITSEHEALKLLYKGEGRKTFANNNDYMSHIFTSVLTFHITTANQDFTSPDKISSRLHIIDMAGIDSVGNRSSNFKNPLDIGNANVIKSNMEQFIMYLMQNVPRHIQVKERASSLIYFLGGDLNFQSILRFIGHIKIRKEDFKITASTLRFGQLVKGFKPKAKEIEPEMNEEIKFQYLQNKIENLQNEKIYHSILMNQDLTLDVNQDRLEHIQATVDAYLHNRITELNVLNVAEASEVFKIFKNIWSVFDEEKAKSRDAEVAKLRRSSKDNSKTSLKNIKSFSKRLKRSKESMTNSSDKTKPADESAASIRSKRPVQINRPATNLGKPPSVILSRKSTAGSSSKDRRESKKDTETPLIADMIPKFEVAWNAFINEGKATYKALSAPYKANEIEIKKAYTNYQKEMKTLQLRKDAVTRRQNELLEAKMYEQFTAFYGSDNVMSDTEKICHENLNQARIDLLAQQEVVLRAQSELKIFLSNRRNLKQNLQEDFDQYCMDNYNVTIPIFIDESVEEEEWILKEESLNIDIRSEEEDEESLEKPLEMARLEKLKKIMENEIRKNSKFKELKNRKWKNVYLK